MEPFTQLYIDWFRTIEESLDHRGWGKRARHGAAIVLGAMLFDRLAACTPGVIVSCPWREGREHARAIAALDPALLDGVASDLGRYRFAIDEDGTGDGDAIDPSVMDAINEALARQERDVHRPGKGTVYTSPAETTFMARLALARHLTARVPGLDHAGASMLAFDLVPPANAVMKEAVARAINAIGVLDPCCGSGSFLLAVAGTCEAIHRAVAREEGGETTTWRRSFCTRSLRGHDIDARALEGTRLRLWCWILARARPGSTIALPTLDDRLAEGDFLLEPPAAGGLDIVIGNPPYIRQEDAGSRTYKRDIVRASAIHFPDVAATGLTCDYYVYFFFASMAWLKPGGTCCLLASNTWLDARYGKALQGFLLRHATGTVIIDHVARSFDQADVNTTITLASRSGKIPANPGAFLDDTIRFVKLDVPLDRIDGSMAHSVCHGEHGPSTRVVSKRDLLGLVGRDANQQDPAVLEAYTGGKWRAEHLDAPDVLRRIVTQAGHALTALGNVASLRTGCYTGLNAFFYLDRATVDRFGIEARACKPLIRSARSIGSLLVDGAAIQALDQFVLCIPPLDKQALIDAGMPGVVSYIEWGETQVTAGGQKTRRGIPWPEVRSFAGRPHWYALPPSNVVPACHFIQYIAHDRFYCPRAVDPVVPDRCFHRVFPREGIDGMMLHALLNSTIQALLALVAGRRGLGGGAMKLETADARGMLAIDPRRLPAGVADRLHAAISALERRPPGSMFVELGIAPGESPWVQEPAPARDRLALDIATCEALGMDPVVLPDVYRATCAAIKERVDKAKSRNATQAARGT